MLNWIQRPLIAGSYLLVVAGSPLPVFAEGPGAKGPEAAHAKHEGHDAKKGGPAADTPAGAATRAAAAPPAAPVAPSGAEVGKALDAMAAACGKAVEVRAAIQELVGKRKTSEMTRGKGQAEVKKRLRAVIALGKQVARASKKPGADTAKLLEAARVEYEGALAQGKTVEVETEALHVAQDELLKLVTTATEATAACVSYEAAVRNAALIARKLVAGAQRDAATARALARVPAPKALEVARARHTKELETLRTDTEGGRTAFEAMKAEAAKQPAAPPAAEKPADKPADQPAAAADKPADAASAKKGVHNAVKKVAAPEAATKPK